MNRELAPNYMQPNSLDIRFPKEIELENGVKLFLIDDVKDDSVKLDIEWCAGSKYQTKKLVANLTNRLLLAGTEGRLSADISEEIDFHGGYVQYEMDRDHAGVTLYGLRENMENIFSVFSEAFINCTFPESEFEKERSLAFTQFKIEAKKVKTTCRRRFNQAIFGGQTNYGQIAELEDFDQIKREDLIAFYKEIYRGHAPTIFIVGRINDRLIEQLREWSLQFKVGTKTFLPDKISQELGRIDIAEKDAIQSAIRFGRLMFDKNHADYFKFQLLNTILGGYFGSRLMTNIREDKGYTYGIGSSMSVMEDAAYFFITTEVGVEVKEQAISEVFKELHLLKNELVADEELQKVKNYMLGDFLRHADGPIAMMENFKNIHFNKLKETYYTDFIKAINEATAEELRALAQRYFKEDELVIVTAG